MVLMTGHKYQKMDNPEYPADLVLTYSVPKRALDGQQAPGWTVLTGADIPAELRLPVLQ